MTKRALINLSLVCLVLVLLYWLSSSDESVNSGSGGRQEKILKHVSWDSLASIMLEKENKNILLRADKSGKWVLPSKNNYPADISTVRSFLLKLMDLSSSQKINSSQQGVEALGLSEQSKDKGKGIIALQDPSGEVQEKIYLGGLRSRKNATDESLLNLSGQYIRLDSTKEVYLVPLPVQISTEASYWMDSEILQIPVSDIYKIEAYELKTDENELLYSLSRNSPVFSDSEPDFKLSLETPSNKEIQDTVVRQISMAIEDMKSEDVYLADNDVVSDLNYDRSVRFYLTNGLIYKINISVKDDVFYLEISPETDDSYVSELKESFEKEMEATDEKESEDKKSNNKKQDSKEIKLITSEELEKEKQRLEDWVFVVAEFVGQKFIKNQDSFFKDIEEEVEEVKSATN